MSETIGDKKIFSLFEVTSSIEKTINERYKPAYWIKAEMNKLNYYRHSGHCYPELVERQNGRVAAQIKAILWSDDYLRINEKFQQTLKEPLKDGIKILFLAKITFDSVHGLSLNIIDIDPAFTLGDIEKEKNDSIFRLKSAGLFDKNKSLKMAVLPQRIAIISVETSKGYADFLEVLQKNKWNYQFFHYLFPAILQGDRAVGSIIAQLMRIKKVINHFDAAAIIRGGGGDIGLSCYNNYDLAREISGFPIPVLTGIGHSTNETVVEMVSFMNAITPTKLAEYLIQEFHNFSFPVNEAEKKIINLSQRLISDSKKEFQSEVKMFRSVTENILISNSSEIKSLSDSLIRWTISFCSSSLQTVLQFASSIRKDIGNLIMNFNSELVHSIKSLKSHGLLKLKTSTSELQNLEKNISNMSPQNVLKRGYSITFLNGKSVKKESQLKNGDTIQTALYEGSILSTVKKEILKK